MSRDPSVPTGFRRFRACVLEEAFDRPGGCDLAEHLRSYLDDFNARRHQSEAVIRMSPAIVEHLPDLLEPAVVRAARDSAGPPNSDGWVRVVIPIESVNHAAGTLLRLGSEAEVLAPTDLRARIAENRGCSDGNLPSRLTDIFPLWKDSATLSITERWEWDARQS